MQKTMVLWDNAHYTRNDNHALNSWCFEERRWRLNIKVKERPFAEGSRDYSCARAFYFENIETILSTVVVLHMCYA